jgi:hypothetical protein
VRNNAFKEDHETFMDDEGFGVRIRPILTLSRRNILGCQKNHGA